jgi:hypothetical protein
MKYNIQIEQLDEKGKVIPIEETRKMIEIKGNVREEFCIDDLTNQISLVERQIQNVKDAGGDEKEIESLFAEMERHRAKIAEVKKEFGLKVELPKIKTEQEIEEKFKPIIINDARGENKPN